MSDRSITPSAAFTPLHSNNNNSASSGGSPYKQGRGGVYQTEDP